MEWAALVAWVLTAAGGLVLLAIWLQHGGMRQAAAGGRRIRPAAILGHFALAATGLVLWLIYVASDSDVLAWVAFVLLLVVAAIGFGMLAVWLAQRRAPAQGTPAPADAPEQRFPTAVVGLHGVLAATTLVLVFLTAVGVGAD